MLFRQHFAVRPIGQGLFYTGKISLTTYFWKEFSFYMVFDCGSMDKAFADLEVEAYLEDIDQKEYSEIDLLVISHFDKDHVSHVKKLVKGRKVKRLVMPFLGFSERLVLSLRLLQSGVVDPDPDDFSIIGFILDPIGSLAESLDGDSEIYLVDSGPEPINPEILKQVSDDGREALLPENDFREENGRWTGTFDYPGKQPLEQDSYFGNTVSRAKVYKVSDSNPALLSSKVYLLMDFIFYRKKLGLEDEAFFNLVLRLFEEKFDARTHDEVLVVLESISSASPIKELFDQAARSLGMPVTTTKDLNTTSLCMMHRNLPGIYKLLGIQLADNDWMYSYCNLYSLLRSVPNGRSRPTARYDFWRYRSVDGKLLFPNTLLTADVPLLRRQDLDNFLNRYRAFIPGVFLIQVPHHGSEKNSGEEFFNELQQLPEDNLDPLFFCNYGLNNRFGHPSGNVRRILGLMPNDKYLPVNEIYGVEYDFSISKK